MSDSDPGQQRNRVVEQRPAALPGQAVDQRDEQNQRHVEEDRHRDDQAGECQRPGSPAVAERVQQPGGDAGGAARAPEHLAEHGAEADDDGDVAQRAAHLLLDLAGDLAGRHPAQESHDQAGDQQRHEGVQPDDDHQRQQQRDAEQGETDERGGGHRP